MKLLTKLIVSATFAAMPILANAEMVFFGNSMTGVEYFYDNSSVQRDKGLTYLLTLFSHETPVPYNDIQYRSAIFRTEIDCKKATVRMLNAQMFAEPYGRGAVVGITKQPSPTQNIEPTGWANDLSKIVCARGK